MTELSPAVRALLQQASAQHNPAEHELERGLDALHASLAFSAPLVAVSAVQASPQVAPPAFSGGALVSTHAVKLYLVAAAVIGSVGTVAVWTGAPEARRVAPPISAPVAAPVQEAPAPASDIGVELARIEAAQHALQRGQPERALAELAEHARAFPNGLLASEREGLRAVALCDAGRAEGRAARDTFLARFGATPIAARVRKACPR
ncbi:MAG TPA: hypothetical protein VFX59_10515 [Polyangiales bacterium]|nr:hypothetical protein [Polyangiales bacterium]